MDLGGPSDRAALRAAMRSIRRGLAPGERAAAAAAVATRAHALLADGGLLAADRPLVVGATIAHDGELDPAPLVASLVADGAHIGYARVHAHTMIFAVAEAERDLVRGPGGIMQPAEDATPIAFAGLDVVLVPLVAFDNRCNRLGRGGGHYDRTFAGRANPPPLLIGLAYDRQLVDDVDPRPHDVALDHVVTPTAVFTR